MLNLRLELCSLHVQWSAMCHQTVSEKWSQEQSRYIFNFEGRHPDFVKSKPCSNKKVAT